MFLLTPTWAETTPSGWQTQKSQHFIIYYQDNSPAGFADELIYRAEDYYNSIVDKLGYRRSDFWSWDNRARIYLYKDAEDFQKNTQRASWAAGVVLVGSREIKTFVGQENFFDTILPHEMTHIIFREFVGNKAIFPLWIEEGVACSQEKAGLGLRMQLAKKLISEDKYIKLGEFSALSDPGQIDPAVFYAQAASLVVFLIHSQGESGFLDFSRALRDGVEWGKALLRTYNFNSLQQLENAWKGFVLKRV
ncbi:MAG: peptidase MA family metallohydrolase [Candidatus Omnitrophica bacterium]|nr:peptidase MA family metallohydrolase [Candidatus Omnitrophota bacterium]